jgi:hypothetical protein
MSHSKEINETSIRQLQITHVELKLYSDACSELTLASSLAFDIIGDSKAWRTSQTPFFFWRMPLRGIMEISAELEDGKRCGRNRRLALKHGEQRGMDRIVHRAA